jgi:hypothetical protein
LPPSVSGTIRTSFDIGPSFRCERASEQRPTEPFANRFAEPDDPAKAEFERSLYLENAPLRFFFVVDGTAT